MSQWNIFGSLDPSDSSRADSRAPTSPQREGAWDSSEEKGVPFGWKCSELSELSSRLGSSLRTFLISSLEGLTPYSLGWRKRVTPRGRWWWALGAWGRRTGGIGSGLSGGDWPTMTVCGNHNRKSASTKSGDGLATATRMEWATPRASENENRTTRMTPSQANGKHGQYLTVQALSEWPTPTAKPYGSNQGGSSGREGQPKRPSLEGAAREWPTPTARDWKSTQASPETHDRNARPLSEVAGLDWPTPKAVDGYPKGNAGGNRKSPGLDAMARSGQLEGESCSIPGNHRGSLNPDWVETLIGAPVGWTDLPEEVVSALWATRIPGKSRI